MIGDPVFQALSKAESVGGGPPPPSDALITSANGSNQIDLYEYTDGLLSFVSNITTTVSFGAALSPDGNYLASVTTSGSRHQVRSRSGTSFTLLTAAGSSTSAFRKPFWVSNTAFLIGTTSNGALALYRVGISGSTSTVSTVTWPGTPPTNVPDGNGQYSCATPAGDYVFIGGNSTTPSAAFAWGSVSDNGATITRLTNPSTIHTGAIRSACWNNDGTVLVVCTTGSPGMHVFERTGDTLTEVSAPSTLPTGFGSGNYASSMAFNSNNELFMGLLQSPFSWVYETSGTTFTSLGSWGTITASEGSFVRTFGTKAVYQNSRSLGGSGGGASLGSLYVVENVGGTLTVLHSINTTSGTSIQFPTDSAVSVTSV